MVSACSTLVEEGELVFRHKRVERNDLTYDFLHESSSEGETTEVAVSFAQLHFKAGH
jgi:hypothetical protein